MNDRQAVALLQWATPRLGLRWRGFKNVRRQVVRRISARMKELGIEDGERYRERLERDQKELDAFGRLCFVTISRFYRDHRVYVALRERLLPELAERAPSPNVLRVWSAGCASGEEPYGVMLVWRLCVAPRFPKSNLTIVATDFNETVLERARAGLYEGGSLRELPSDLRDRAFDREVSSLYRVRDEIRQGVSFARADVRSSVPDGPIDLLLCRNLVFTYFDEASQRAFVERALSVLGSDGLLIVGSHETIPEGVGLVPHPELPLVFVRT